MSAHIAAHQEQAIADSPATIDAGSEPVEIVRIDASATSDARKGGGPERRKPFGGFSFGAPLTAAFIGGFLVIENFADAGQLDGIDAAASPDSLDLLNEGQDGLNRLPSADGAETTLNGRDAVEGGAEDVAASGSDGASPGGQAASAGLSGTAMPAIAAANGGAGPSVVVDGGGAGANLTLLNINIGTGEDSELEPIVEDEVISRNRKVGTPGDDVLIGTDGHDSISGAEGDDIIRGEGGSDILNGNGGDDQLFGGTGRDTLNGGAGNDSLDGGNDGDLDLLRGGLGDDVIFVNSHLDVALERDFGAYADDQDLVVVRGGYADDLPNGEDSATFVFADNLGSSLPSGASGYRQLLSDGIENVRLEGTADHDIFADALDNRLTGNDGANVIHGGAGDDQLSGGAGSDRLSGGAGDDEISGGAGDDRIEGGRGEDFLYGDGGDDVFVIGLNDSAIDTIFDHEGANHILLDGVDDQTVGATVDGDDLYVTVDGAPVAMVRGYVGQEDALAGIDYGQGLQTIDTLLRDHPDIGGAVSEAEARAAEASGDDLLAAHLHLTEPTITGAPRTDQRLDGGESDDWLSGFDGKDILFGKGGDDILEGGDGSDQLRGGAGDDRYLFSKGDRGIDKIQDNEGRNLAELKGYDRADIDGHMLGDDLAVLADGKVLFTVDDFASNDGHFQGVQAGNRFIPTEDLLA